VSHEDSNRQSLFKRRVPLKWALLAFALLLVIMAAIIVTVLLVDRRDDARREAAVAATSTTEFASPYDFTELPADADLGMVKNATFVSVLLIGEDSRPIGYGISSERPAAQVLIEAVRQADEVNPGDRPDVAAGAPAQLDSDDATIPAITFVFADRTTLTFTLDLEHGLITRGERAWRPEGDIQALIDAAISGV